MWMRTFPNPSPVLADDTWARVIEAFNHYGEGGALTRRRPYAAVLAAQIDAPGNHNRVRDVVMELGLPDYDVAEALNISTCEAAMLIAIGHSLSNRELLLVVGRLRDFATEPQESTEVCCTGELSCEYLRDKDEVQHD